MDLQYADPSVRDLRCHSLTSLYRLCHRLTSTTLRSVSRWEPDAKGRLAKAALDLYAERGFDQTTVAEIAAQAGLTERTFFRYFVDKREVLFFGAAELQALLVTTVADAPEDASPLTAVAGAIDLAAALLQGRREGALQRQAVINANTELQERELIKLSTLAAAMADVLRARGVREPAASLAGEAGIAVFRIAFESWIDVENDRDFQSLIGEAFEELRNVAAR
jgi:AcrR family transcriptional regulator